MLTGEAGGLRVVCVLLLLGVTCVLRGQAGLVGGLAVEGLLLR